MCIRDRIDYWREIHLREGYQEVSTPIILSRKLWENSGHWDHYKDNMYTTVIDEEDYAVKPMNCPGAVSYTQLREAAVGNIEQWPQS